MQKFFFSIVASALLMPAAHGQPAPADLHALFNTAWERSVAFQATEGRRLEAAASRVQADALIAGPPTLGLLHRDDRWTENRGLRESEVQLGVPVWMPGQRAARGDLADAQAAEAEAGAALARLNVAAEVRERVWQLVAAEGEHDVLRRRAEIAASLRDDVRRRVSAGDLARTDLLLAQQDYLAAQGLLADSESRLVDARARLLQATGVSALPQRYDEAAAAVGDPAASVPTHPRLEAAQRAVLRSERQVGYLRKSRRDPPEVGVLYRSDRAGGGMPSDQTIGLFVKIPFATDARNLPRETAAQTELMTARAELDRTERIVRAEIDAAQAALSLAGQQLKLTEERSATLSERAALLRKTFNAGEIGLPEVLRAQNQALEAEADLARQRARRGIATANLNQALGVLP
ncbi:MULTISPECIES: TolC family protein [unclassified Cupriavidus]|uniref:TolC family protein n=1 Tax=unclassified Cupriavidus TaxID=2640874 RepID=UPI001AE51131|nr:MULTISPECIES: TolC family protein [unclassified Cupriavidus]MBP0628238.1 TolC family protein [Cupriavidus sp. AcVe19-1a]MBP0636188.1 TolC family protein [Cupriavidus sp. AcVe19-6a]